MRLLIKKVKFVRYFVSILVLQSFDGEERAGCLAWFVFLVFCGGWAALPGGARGCLQFVIVVFPDHTHLLFFMHKPPI